MRDKEKIIDILLEFYEEYQDNIPNRPMIPNIYASKIINSMQEEPVSEDNTAMGSLWKPADGEDLPEIDREVIVLIKYNAQRNIHAKEYSTYRVGFGHRPNPNGWDGKNIDTNEVTHYTPKLYGKGGWNIPDVKYWLDCPLPKMKEE